MLAIAGGLFHAIKGWNEAGAAAYPSVATDGAALERFVGASVETGEFRVTVRRVYHGAKVNPMIRDSVLAECRDEVVFKVRIRNESARRAALSATAFTLHTAAGNRPSRNYVSGFTPAALGPFEARTCFVGFAYDPLGAPCRLQIGGAAIDVCLGGR